jgi:hypothetical protein
MKKNSVNVFDIIGRINNDFGNLVFIARSFPSVDVKIDGKKINIHTYCVDEPTCSEGRLEIEIDDSKKKYEYSIKRHNEQTDDGETTTWDEVDYKTTDVFQVVSEIANVIIVEDDSCHDEDPANWESGMFPDEYYDHCLKFREGIFKNINNNTKFESPWA